jgi:hypothetical protein
MDNIKRFNVTTKAGNTLSFFYNPDNDLVVVDLIHKNERGGNEILRQTLDEKKLIGFCTKLRNPDSYSASEIEKEIA